MDSHDTIIYTPPKLPKEEKLKGRANFRIRLVGIKKQAKSEDFKSQKSEALSRK